MKCPVCTGVDLVMSDRQGVEIDYCPQCRGVWLDRGELDKIIERSAPHASRTSSATGGGHDGGYAHKHEHEHKHKKSKGSLLGELFDF